jgi:hypothetical protein
MIRKLIIALLLFLVLYFVFLRPENPSKTTDMPQTLIGVWATDSPRYAKRFIKLDKKLLTMELGEFGTTIYTIKELKRRMDGNQESFELVYGQNNEPDQSLHFEYDSADGGTIKIRNQKDVVWTRHKEP